MVEVVKENVVVRGFEIGNNGRCLNGNRSVYKGVDRHEFCSTSGRVMIR